MQFIFSLVQNYNALKRERNVHQTNKTTLLVTPKELASRQVNQIGGFFPPYTYLNFSTK